MIPWLLLSLWSGTVEGTAFDRVTKAPVAGVVVNFGSYKAETNAAGAFRIDDVAEGDYTPAFLAPKNFLAPFGSAPACRSFHVKERTVKLEIPMIPMGSVRGRVLDPDGRPAAKVFIQVFRAHGSDGAVKPLDGEGRFWMTGLVPGAYLVRAQPAVDGWAPTYFPGAVDMASAEKIFVREGVEVGGIVIRIRSVPTYRLRGIARDNEGRPAAGVGLYLLSGNARFNSEAQTKSDADGSFEFPKVRAGPWTLHAELTRDKILWAGRADVTMPDRDFDKAEIRIDPPFRLEIAVEGIPASRRRPMFVLLEPEGADDLATIEEEGRLRFDTVYPGRFRFEHRNAVPGHYVKAVLLGTKDVIDIAFDLGPSSEPLRVVVAPNAARAAGNVENGPGVKVLMIRTDGSSIRFEVADAQGNFTFEGLRPGDWYAFAFDTSDNMNTGAIREVLFERGLARQAEVISLKEGETANLKLRISPWLQ